MLPNTKLYIRNQALIPVLQPGINSYKQVELYQAYGKLLKDKNRIITCPRLSKEVFDLVSEEKYSNNKRKKDKKILKLMEDKSGLMV